MKPFSCLAVDMGAGSIRIVQGIFDGKLILKEIHRFNNHIERIDGADRWNLEKITRGIATGIDKALSQTDVPITSIGVDSWGVDFVLVGDDGKPVENPVSYRDQRTSGMKYLWNTMMPEMETFLKTGINHNVFNTLYQLLSIRDAESLACTNRILFMADYINYFLSGTAVNEITLSSTSQMLSCTTGNWEPQITKLLKLKEGLLTKPVLPGTKIGFYNNGLVSSKLEVVVVAGHDTACAVTAIPGENDNFAFLSTGTWCIMGMVSDYPIISDDAFKMGITNERTSDGRFRPLKNIMGLWLIQQLRVAFGSKHSYDEIDQMAAKAPPSEMLVSPNEQIFYNPSDMKKAFDEYLFKVYGKTLLTEAAYYRCAYDSLAAAFSETITELETLRNKPFDVIHITGGGSQSEILCRLTAKATGKKIVAGPVEAAVTGNLLIQAKAAGYYTNNSAIKKQIKALIDVQYYFPD